MLAAIGFVAAAQVADVSILPMPSQELEAPAQTGDAAVSDEAAATEQVEPEAEKSQESEATKAVDATEEQAPEMDEPAPLPQVDPAWTDEEIAALREMARERIAAQEMMNDFSKYLRQLWEHEVTPWLDEVEERAVEEVPSKDEVLESVDTWLEERNLPERDRLTERWNEIIDHISQSTGIAMDDAKEIGRDWIEAQRDLIEDVMEDVKELRDEIRSASNPAEND